MRRLLSGVLAAGILAVLVATPLHAQNTANQNQAQLRLVIVDQTGAGIPAADVTITPKSGGEPVTYKSDEKGLATSPNLPPGDVTVHVEFPGFIPFDAPLTLRRGAQNQVVELKIEGFKAEIAVNDTTVAEASKSTSSFSLSQEEIDALPDDPEELAEILSQMAGPGGATFFMNGFQGGRLPNRDQIRSIRFRQNNYAADNHDAGRSQVEIITRPNTNWGGQLNTNWGGDRFNARRPQQMTEQPSQERQVSLSARGPIKAGRTSFNFNVSGRDDYNSNPIIAKDVFGNTLDIAARSTNTQRGFQGGLEHSINANHGLYFNFQRSQNERLNNGGGYSLPERGTTNDSNSTQTRFRLQGIIGGSKLHEFRVQVSTSLNETASLTDAPTINVQEAFNKGGAGQNSRNSTDRVEIADNFDFNIGTKHQMRVGVLLEGLYYSNFDERNLNGTMTYGSIDDFNAGKPQQYSIRIGSLDTSFSQYQGGIYWSDEFRVHRDVTLGLGVRNEFQSRIDDKLNLMPRVGFTWAPFGSQRSAVRGGYGLFYDWYESSLYDQTLRVDGVTVRDVRLDCDLYNCADVAALDLLSLSGVAGRIQAAEDLQMPRVHQASISYDRQLTSSVVLQTSYQMLRGRHTMRSININAPLLVDGNFVIVNGIRARPNMAFGDITQFESTGRTQSDRFSVGTQIRYQVAQQQMGMRFTYTLGQEKNFANSATALPSDSLNPDVDWGPANNDIRHRFQVQGQVPLLLGIRANINSEILSGRPYNMTTGDDNNKDGAFNDRPEGVTRNSLRGDWTWNLNFNVSRRINLRGLGTPVTPTRAQGNGALFAQQGGGGFGGGGGGQGGGNFGRGNQGNNNQRFTMELFAQVSNLLNHVTRTGYVGNLRSADFGRAIQVGNARDINVGVRFNF
ncbi:MAG TPA: TonB-dependent receptor [Vicinamibacterales bacterium]|nr:TonB-dependent receptor [Vicinamibacterales bacterium]